MGKRWVNLGLLLLGLAFIFATTNSDFSALTGYVIYGNGTGNGSTSGNLTDGEETVIEWIFSKNNVNDKETFVRIKGTGFENPFALNVDGILVTDTGLVELRDDGNIYFKILKNSPAREYPIRVVTLKGMSEAVILKVEEKIVGIRNETNKTKKKDYPLPYLILE